MAKFDELLEQLRLNPNDQNVKREVQDWVRQHHDDKQTILQLEEHWNRQDINLSNIDSESVEKVFSRITFSSNINSTPFNSKSKRRSRWLNIAAGFVLPILMVSAWLMFQKQYTVLGALAIQKSNTEIKHFFLPDSTEVWLNSGSELSYAKNFSQADKRLVNLKGQAYFKVYHDASHPFIVQTAKMDIKVLGTSFDVSAYDDDSTVSSTLVEGSIAVLDKDGQQMEVLVPGEQMVMSLSNASFHKNTVVTSDFISWKSGQLLFQDADLIEVTRKLSRRYGCQISVGSELVKAEHRFNFRVQNESLKEICTLLALTANATVIFNEERIVFETK